MNDHSELVGDMAELIMEFQAKYSKQNSYKTVAERPLKSKTALIVSATHN